ncbi:MAG: hypothetical protein FWC00_02875 [Firmicutes bacterium]|nr:hypothetical protein [Bacillota bacterium]
MNTPYVTQYCNLRFEWQSLGITIDTATENQARFMHDLKQKAIEQSGLTDNELDLISVCRRYRLLKQVYTYARGIKSLPR